MSRFGRAAKTAVGCRPDPICLRKWYARGDVRCKGSFAEGQSPLAELNLDPIASGRRPLCVSFTLRTSAVGVALEPLSDAPLRSRFRGHGLRMPLK